MAAKPKRFYKEATVEPTPAGFEVRLDGRVLKTVGRKPLVLSAEMLARMVAEEWQAQQEAIDAERMPATRLANIALDRVPLEREAILADMMLYADTDLLCHRAREEELRQQQMEHWDPVVAYIEEAHGIRMVVTTGVVPVPQPAASLAQIREMLGKASDEQFAALAMLVPLLGSILLTLALWQKGITLDAALSACRVDEAYQQARWGRDEEADSMWQAKLRDMQACARWLTASS